MRLLLTTIILIMLAQPALADGPPVIFNCEMFRICELSALTAKRERECRPTKLSTPITLIYKENEAFWIDDERYQFAEITQDEHNKYKFMGETTPYELKLSMPNSAFIFDKKASKWDNTLVTTMTSHQQTFVRFFVCKE